MLNRIDLALQATTPTVMVPKHEAFMPMTHNGHRFLAASNGLWLEAKRDWLYLCWPLAEQNAISMPYGSLERQIKVQKVPSELVKEFIAFAKEEAPNECAALIIWNSSTNQTRLEKMIPFVVGPGEVDYKRPSLKDDEHIVIDLHSHGEFGAYFSPKDDKDDRSEFKVAGVFGRVKGELECCFRLCANGFYINMGNKWE